MVFILTDPRRGLVNIGLINRLGVAQATNELCLWFLHELESEMRYEEGYRY